MTHALTSLWSPGPSEGRRVGSWCLPRPEQIGARCCPAFDFAISESLCASKSHVLCSSYHPGKTIFPLSPDSSTALYSSLSSPRWDSAPQRSLLSPAPLLFHILLCASTSKSASSEIQMHSSLFKNLEARQVVEFRIFRILETDLASIPHTTKLPAGPRPATHTQTHSYFGCWMHRGVHSKRSK